MLCNFTIYRGLVKKAESELSKEAFSVISHLLGDPEKVKAGAMGNDVTLTEILQEIDATDDQFPAEACIEARNFVTREAAFDEETATDFYDALQKMRRHLYVCLTSGKHEGDLKQKMREVCQLLEEAEEKIGEMNI